MPNTQQKEWWQNRIVKYGESPAGQFLAHDMNARRHPAKQREALRGSLNSLGWIAPVVVSAKTGKMLDGHARIEEALSKDDEMMVPFVEVEVSEDEERLILATLDPISALASYDKEALDALLHETSTGDAALQQLLSDLAEKHDLYFGEQPQPGAGGDEFDAAPDEAQTRVMYGDLWQCGAHRVLCGDSTRADDVAKVMAGENAALCLTDPPYGIGENYASYDDSEANLEALVAAFLPLARSVAEIVMLTPGNKNQRFYPHPNWTLCWFVAAATGRGPWGFTCWQPVLAYGADPYLAAGMGSRPDGLAKTESADNSFGHPCPKPIGVWSWFLERGSIKNGDIVFDPFGGGGTTLIACERTKRKARLIEIEPKYVNVILSRWEAETGKQAQLLERSG